VRVGFYERQKIGLGVFITRAEIEKRPPTQRVTDLIMGRAGVHVMGGYIVFRSAFTLGGCSPRVFIDGLYVLDSLRVSDGIRTGINNYLHSSDVEAIEIYRGPAEVPPQYGGAAACGVVLIWLRQGREMPGGT
jgi:outer membrane receptor for ferrienterochelin and colicin